MRILLVGAGGVGDAIAKIAARRDFFELMVVSDYDLARAERTVEAVEGQTPSAPGIPGLENGRFVAARIDASDPDSVAAVAREHGATHVMNAVEPKFVPTIFAGALAAGDACTLLTDTEVGTALGAPIDPGKPIANPATSCQWLGKGKFATLTANNAIAGKTAVQRFEPGKTANAPVLRGGQHSPLSCVPAAVGDGATGGGVVQRRGMWTACKLRRMLQAAISDVVFSRATASAGSQDYRTHTPTQNKRRKQYEHQPSSLDRTVAYSRTGHVWYAGSQGSAGTIGGRGGCGEAGRGISCRTGCR